MRPTPDLCDDHADSVQVVTGLHWHSYGGRERFGGPIATVKCFEDNSRVKELLATEGNGRVLVVDGGGSLRNALIGDMIAAGARDNGWAGIVIFGACRDVDVLRDMDFGVFALGCVPRKSVRRGEGQTDLPIHFGGVTFRPGDYVYADANGIIASGSELA
ncbi:MAG: putative 4-hydroxy-4-methyl-2-oxoglutarate aldolase [Gammaproteobacteria bacterium]|jgi:regulator of ribonuclease activity A|nr:putative 4-hydroxy-4-methyl-2-oxoglutarate aldolase [Gammaproteobacteria bacterium]